MTRQLCNPEHHNRVIESVDFGSVPCRVDITAVPLRRTVSIVLQVGDTPESATQIDYALEMLERMCRLEGKPIVDLEIKQGDQQGGMDPERVFPPLK